MRQALVMAALSGALVLAGCAPGTVRHPGSENIEIVSVTGKRVPDTRFKGSFYSMGSRRDSGVPAINGALITFRMYGDEYTATSWRKPCSFRAGLAVMSDPDVFRIEPNNPGGCTAPGKTARAKAAG